MTQDELKALIAQDESDLVDILTTTVKQVPDTEGFVFAVMQMQMLARVLYWTCDVLAASIGGWGSEAAEVETEKYDA